MHFYKTFLERKSFSSSWLSNGDSYLLERQQNKARIFTLSKSHWTHSCFTYRRTKQHVKDQILSILDHTVSTVATEIKSPKMTTYMNRSCGFHVKAAGRF